MDATRDVLLLVCFGVWMGHLEIGTWKSASTNCGSVDNFLWNYWLLLASNAPTRSLGRRRINIYRYYAYCFCYSYRNRYVTGNRIWRSCIGQRVPLLFNWNHRYIVGIWNFNRN